MAETAAPASTAVATRNPSNFEIELARYEPQFVAALPSHISVEKFRRVVITAVNQNAALAKADRRSLFNACVRAAQDGLLPDGREAALVIFAGAVQYMPMIHGIRKRMRNTGEVLSADAQVVFQKDHFDYRLGDAPMIDHKPALGDRGEPIGAYAIIKLTNGEILREYMSRAEIEKVRAVSRAAKNGPWVTWWEEMARKTTLRRCSKAAPTSPDIEALLNRDTEDERPMPQFIPDRPTRDDEQHEERPEPFVFQDSEGVVTEDLTDPKQAAEAFNALIDAAPTGDALQALWESNTLSAQLRDRGYADLAEAMLKSYADALSLHEKIARDKKNAETAKAAEKPVDPQAEHKDAGSAGDAGQPAQAEPWKPSPAPKSPMSGKDKGDWPTWARWFVETIRAMPKDQLDGFMKANAREYDFIVHNRSGDADAIAAALDERRAA